MPAGAPHDDVECGLFDHHRPKAVILIEAKDLNRGVLPQILVRVSRSLRMEEAA